MKEYFNNRFIFIENVKHGFFGQLFLEDFPSIFLLKISISSVQQKIHLCWKALHHKGCEATIKWLDRFNGNYTTFLTLLVIMAITMIIFPTTPMVNMTAYNTVRKMQDTVSSLDNGYILW